MENESHHIQVGTPNIHYMKRNVSPGPYKQSATFPRRYLVSWAAPWQETYLIQTHFRKTEKLRITYTKKDWLLGRKSKLPTSNKLLMYKTILKPIWTYGIQLWGMASASNIEILEHFQSKALHMKVDAPCYVPNMVIRRNLQIRTVKEEFRRYSSQCSARINTYPSDLIVNLRELPYNRRLWRHLPNYLPTRFLV
jgi:hypothetical protein